jgi:prepilin-type N-terminal cleavage/methylation domain-containing protein
MRTRRLRIPTARRAFTLLEVLLATAIGVILLAALYAAVDIQYKHAQAARDVVEQSTLARALLARMGNDIACSAGPADPSRFRTSTQGSASGQSGSTQQSGQGTTGQTTGSTQTTQPSTGGAAPASTTTGQTTDPASGTAGAVSGLTAGGNFLFTLSGDSESLSLFVTRVPRELTMLRTNPNANPGVVTDLRRISYWLVSGSGLAFEEIRPVTSDEAAGAPPDTPDGVNSRILAAEVRSLSFSYFDGSGWQSSWDGTAVGSDGQTPIGPPMAVAITLGLAAPGTPPGVESKVKMYRHVVSLMTANGPSQQTKTEETP